MSDELFRTLAAVGGVIVLGIFIRALASVLQGIFDYMKGDRNG